jgi:hypothetical protein
MSARQFRSSMAFCAALFFVTGTLQSQQTAGGSPLEPPTTPAELFSHSRTTIYTLGKSPFSGERIGKPISEYRWSSIAEDERDEIVWRYTKRGALIGALAGIAYVHVRTWGKCQDCMIPLPFYYPRFALPGAAVGAIGRWLWGEATLPRDPSP